MAHSRQIFFVFALFLVIALARYFIQTPAHISEPLTPHPADSSPQQTRIEGRWKSVYASLGMPPRPSSLTMVYPSPPRRIARASRFDLRRRRAVEESSSSGHVQLHFSPDALEEPSVSLEALAESFRAVSLFEKESAEERARERLRGSGRSQRRPLSWTTKGDENP